MIDLTNYHGMSARGIVIFIFSLVVFFSTGAWAQPGSIDSLENEIAQTPDPAEKLRLYVELVEIYNSDFPSEKGIQKAIEAIELAIKNKDELSRAKLLRLRGQMHNDLFQSDYDRAMSYFFDALAIARRLQTSDAGNLDYANEEASALNSIAYLYWQWGKLTQSKHYYDSAIAVSSQIWARDSSYTNNIRLLGLEHNSKGAVLWGMGNYHEAIAHYFSAIPYFEKLGMTKHQSLTNTNIGLIYNSWGQKEEALFYFRRAAAVGTRSGDASAMGYALSNMGRFKESAGEVDSALYYYQLSTEKYTQADNMWGIGLNLVGTGRMFAKMGDYDKSLSAFNEALRRAEQNRTYYWVAQANYNISTTLASKGELALALQYAQECNRLAEENGYKEILKDNHLNISGIYEKRNDFRKALAHYQLHSTLRDSLFSEDKFKQITLMKEQFETEKRERENEILRKDGLLQQQNLQRSQTEKLGLSLLLALTAAFAFSIVLSRNKIKRINTELNSKNLEITRQKEELSVQASELKKSNEIKNLMFSIVSHDLRQPIVNVGNLVNMLNSEVISQEDLRHMLPSVADNIGQVTNLTDNLLYWARSQMEGIKVTPQLFDLREHVASKMPFYEKAARDKGILLINTLNDSAPVYADAYMVELILRNLISNAIKFCTAAHTITLSAVVEKGSTIVSVKDTGQGIPPEHLGRIFKDVQFSTAGTRNEKGVGLGLMICKHFVELNSGSIWVESIYHQGSTFSFRLPNQPPQPLAAPTMAGS